MAFAFQPVYNRLFQILGTRGSNRDITDRKQAEMERESLIRDLEDALFKVKM